MISENLFIIAMGVFVLMLIGLGLTIVEFRQNEQRIEEDTKKGHKNKQKHLDVFSSTLIGNSNKMQ